MTSPRHLWSGRWREDSDRAAASAPAALPPGPPEEEATRENGAPRPREEPPTLRMTPADRPAAAPPPSGPSRRPVVVLSLLCALLAAFALGTIVSGGNDSHKVVMLPAVKSPPVRQQAGQTRAGAIYAAASPAVVSISTGSGSGTGFLVNDTRTIVTNAHVVDNSTRVRVRFGMHGRTLDGQVLGMDASSDLAVVRVASGSAPRGARPLAFADSDKVSVGDQVVAIGNPFGLDRTATAGIVSGLGRDIQAPNGFSIPGAIQTDAPINPGNSGGPLLDVDGHVIGVNSQIETGSGSNGNIGIGFAVPSNTVRQVVPQLAEGRTIDRAWLGVQTGETVTGDGAVVADVTAGGPADQAGIRAGDVIHSFAGRVVHDPTELSTAVASLRPGANTQAEVVRGGIRRTITVALGHRPNRIP